jgi:hypothetical protein
MLTIPSLFAYFRASTRACNPYRSLKMQLGVEKLDRKVKSMNEIDTFSGKQS